MLAEGLLSAVLASEANRAAYGPETEPLGSKRGTLRGGVCKLGRLGAALLALRKLTCNISSAHSPQHVMFARAPVACVLPALCSSD